MIERASGHGGGVYICSRGSRETRRDSMNCHSTRIVNIKIVIQCEQY